MDGEGVTVMKIFQNDWGELLADEMKKPYYQELRRFLIDEYRTRRVFPDMYAIFNALHCTSFAETKVVILGQDPYHGEGQAHGLSFSVQPGIEPPPSLKNIFEELSSDLGCRTPKSGCLAPWAKQGVLLLNTVLTVRAHAAAYTDLAGQRLRVGRGVRNKDVAARGFLATELERIAKAERREN